MARRGLAIALVAITLLGGCASFADQIEESSRHSRAASSTSSSASASASTSATTPEATTSSAPSSTTAAPTTTSPAATTAVATTPAPAPAPAPVDKPAEVGAAFGQEPWAVYLIVARDYTAAERSRMEAVHRDLQAFGYRGYLGTLCDEGAEAVGVDPYGDAVVIYFRTQAEAQRFRALWNRPAVGTARVLIMCGD